MRTHNVHTYTRTHKLLLSHWSDPLYFLRRKLATWDGAPRCSHYWGLGEPVREVGRKGGGAAADFPSGPRGADSLAQVTRPSSRASPSASPLRQHLREGLWLEYAPRGALRDGLSVHKGGGSHVRHRPGAKSPGPFTEKTYRAATHASQPNQMSLVQARCATSWMKRNETASGGSSEL